MKDNTLVTFVWYHNEQTCFRVIGPSWVLMFDAIGFTNEMLLIDADRDRNLEFFRNHHCWIEIT